MPALNPRSRAASLICPCKPHAIALGSEGSDYTPATDLADEQWRSHLHELAHEARQQALSDRQVKSRLDSHYHEKAA